MVSRVVAESNFPSINPFKNFTATLAALLQSGQPINRVPNASLYSIVNSKGKPIGGTTNDLNGDGGAFGDSYVGNSDRFPSASRNSDRLPWNTTLDLGIQYLIPVTSKTRLELRADVFNILNTVNLSGSPCHIIKVTVFPLAFCSISCHDKFSMGLFSRLTV